MTALTEEVKIIWFEQGIKTKAFEVIKATVMANKANYQTFQSVQDAYIDSTLPKPSGLAKSPLSILVNAGLPLAAVPADREVATVPEPGVYSPRQNSMPAKSPIVIIPRRSIRR